MAVLDELIVKIRADVKGFKKNIAVATKSAMSASKKMANAFGGMRRKVNDVGKSLFSFRGALGAAAGVAGLGYLVKSTAESIDQQGKLAESLGISGSLLQELSFAASQTGVSQNDLNASLQRFNRRAAEAANGNKAFKKGFDQLGVSLRDDNDQLKDTEQLVKEVADGTQKLGNVSEQAAALFTVFGDSGFRLVNMMNKGSAELSRFQTQARELGLVLEDDMFESAADLNDQLDVMSKVLTTQVSKAVLELGPQLTDLAENLIAVAKAATEVFSGNLFIKDDAEQVEYLTKRVEYLKEVLAEANDSSGMQLGPSLSEEQIQKAQEQLVIAQAELKGLTQAQDDNTESGNKNADALNAQQKALKDLSELKKEAQKIAEAATSGGEQGQIENELEMLREAKDQKLDIQADLNEAIKEKEIELQEFKNEQRRAEIEKLLERNELLKELDAQKYQFEINANKQKVSDLMKQEEGLTNFKLKMMAKQKKDEEKSQMTRKEAFDNFTGSLVSIGRSGNKQLFEVGKAAASAKAIVNTYEGASKALAQGGVFGPALAAGVIAAGFAQVANIQAQTYNKGVDSVPGIGNQDTVPAVLTPGERVVPKETNKDLKRFLSQGGGARDVSGNIRIELAMTDDFVESLEAKLVERGVLGTTLEAS